MISKPIPAKAPNLVYCVFIFRCINCDAIEQIRPIFQF